MKTNVAAIHKEFRAELANEGIHLNRAHRRALKKAEKAKLNRPREHRPVGLGLLARRYCAGTAITEQDQKAAMGDFFAALATLSAGRCSDDNMDVLIYAVNIAYLLTEIDPGMGIEHRSTLIKPALDALHRVMARKKTHGKYGVDGEGLAALRAFSELHEVQLEMATHAELQACIAEMHRRIDAENFKFVFDAVAEARAA